MTFKDLGLLVVDEEQRFGVAHKERLKKLRAHVDVLTMTATPDPAHARDGAHRDPRHVAPSTRRRRIASPCSRTSARTTRTWRSARSAASCSARVRSSGCTTGSRRSTGRRRWLQEQLPEARVVVAHGQMDEDAPRAADDAVLGPRGRRARLHHDHRERSGRARTRTRSSSTAPTCSGSRRCTSCAAASVASTERAFAYFFFPPQRELTRGGARAPRDHRAAPGARQRVPDRAARPGDPRRRQPARRRAARPHRGGRLRHVLPDPAGVGRGDEGRAGPPRRRSSGSTCP